MDDRSTLSSTLLWAARQGKGGLRFLDRQERPEYLSWNQLAERALATAARLETLGIEPGQRVALVFPTGPEFFDAFFGTVLAGGVPVPLYPPVRLGRLGEYHRQTAAMITAAGARLVLAAAMIKRLLGETMALARPALGCRTLDELGSGGDHHAGFCPAAVGPEDLAMVQFSSGTTVDPKPVALSHRAVMAQATILNSFWPDEAGGEPVSGVSWLPLYHDMGLIGCVFPALERPADLTLIGPEAFVTRPALWLRAISRYRARVSPAPNFAYGLCLSKVRDEELEGVDLSCWRVALNGAEAVAPAVLRGFAERFARWGFRPEALTPVYGLSEASLAVTFSALDRPFTARRFDRDALARGRIARAAADGQEIASVGRPLPGFALKVLGPGGDEVATGEVGRIWVSGPSLMSGYLGRPEATAAALRDGWLDTGDLGFLWEGELFLVGRAKDVLILRGRNFAPEAVERAVDAVAGARIGCTVAVSRVAEGAATERLLVFVEASREASREELAELAAEAQRAILAATGLTTDEVVVVEAGTLPRTSSGKLRRQEALRRHLAGELAAPAPVNALRMAGALARSGLAYARLRLGAGGG